MSNSTASKVQGRPIFKYTCNNCRDVLIERTVEDMICPACEQCADSPANVSKTIVDYVDEAEVAKYKAQALEATTKAYDLLSAGKLHEAQGLLRNARTDVLWAIGKGNGATDEECFRFLRND